MHNAASPNSYMRARKKVPNSTQKSSEVTIALQSPWHPGRCGEVSSTVSWANWTWAVSSRSLRLAEKEVFYSSDLHTYPSHPNFWHKLNIQRSLKKFKKMYILHISGKYTDVQKFSETASNNSGKFMLNVRQNLSVVLKISKFNDILKHPENSPISI